MTIPQSQSTQAAARPMVLFFPQYQAGEVPSNIPAGTPALRDLWRGAEGFAEVPLQPTDDNNPQIEQGVRFRAILMRQLTDARKIVSEDRPDFILTTGGDCGGSFVPIAYMNALYGGKIGVVWVDAHGDIHNPASSPSQNYHGMVLRHLLGDPAFEIQAELPLHTGQIAYLGLRDTEAAEDEFIAANNIPRYNARDLMADDNAPLERIVAHFRAQGITHLHLHVDCDVMDKDVFPHVHVPEPDGLSLERLLDILQYLRGEMPMASCCLTEYAPAVAGDGLDIVRRVYSEGLGLTLPE